MIVVREKATGKIMFEVETEAEGWQMIEDFMDPEIEYEVAEI